MLGRCSGNNISGHVHMSDVKNIKSRVKLAEGWEKNGNALCKDKLKDNLPKLRETLGKMIAAVKENKHNPQKAATLKNLDLALLKLESKFENSKTNNKPAEHTEMSKYDQRQLRKADYAAGGMW